MIARKLNRQQSTLAKLSGRVAQMIAELDRDSPPAAPARPEKARAGAE